MDIALISCVKKKRIGVYRAQDLYISDYFKKSSAYCIKNYSKVYILSAKYGVLSLDDKIKTYEMTLNTFTKNQIIDWATKVYYQLKCKINKNDILYFYVGSNYRDYLIPLLDNKCVTPLKGLGIGKQLKFFKDNTDTQLTLI